MLDNLVSVIISVYNGDKFIKQCLDSVVNQTYSPIEIIVCDDGSTDSTADIIKSYENKVKYIYQMNSGQGIGRNNAAEHARGIYYAFIDADDIWHKNKIEYQMLQLAKDDTTVSIYSDMSVIDENGKFLNYHACGKMKKGMIFDALLLENFIGLSSLIVKKSAFDECGGFSNHRYCQDFVLLLKLSSKYKFDFVNLPLVYYRQHSQSLTTNLQLTFGETIEYFKTIPFEYNLTSSQRLICSERMLNLYTSYAFLSFLRENYLQSKKVLVLAKNYGLQSWKLSLLDLLNDAPCKIIFVHVIKLLKYVKIMLLKIVFNNPYK